MEEGLAEFWARSSAQPWFREHPDLQDSSLLNRTLPLVFHVDGVEVFSNTEANIWSFSSAVTSGHTHDVKFPILAIMEADMKEAKAELCGRHRASRQDAAMDQITPSKKPWTPFDAQGLFARTARPIGACKEALRVEWHPGLL
jgi:hypothetical protein